MDSLRFGFELEHIFATPNENEWAHTKHAGLPAFCGSLSPCLTSLPLLAFVSVSTFGIWSRARLAECFPCNAIFGWKMLFGHYALHESANNDAMP